MSGTSSSAELHDLTAGTEYLLSVHAVSEAGVGEGLRTLVTTGGGRRQSGVQSSSGARHRPRLLCDGASLNRSDPPCPLPNTSDVMRVPAHLDWDLLLLLLPGFWDPHPHWATAQTALTPVTCGGTQPTTKCVRHTGHRLRVRSQSCAPATTVTARAPRPLALPGAQAHGSPLGTTALSP